MSEELGPEQHRLATSDTPSSHRRGQIIATALAVMIGALVLFLAITDEPYHIDELRQVQSYSSGLREIADLSFAQEQPPLDSMLNALVQRQIGVGDVQQRLLSVLFGIGSLVLIGALALRNGFGWGSPVSVLILGLSPLLVSVTAYARPYAFPLFLILALTLSIDIWLSRPRLSAGVIILVTAFLLPLSRTIEPNLALAATVGVLILGKYVFKAKWSGTIWVPVASALAAMALVGVPIILRLRVELDQFTASAPLQTKLARLVTDLPSTLADVFPWWPVFFLILVLAFVFEPARRKLASLWWFWVAVAIPTGFVTIFILQTAPGQRYFDRYTFTWWLPVAVAAGALIAGVVEWERDRLADPNRSSCKRVLQITAAAAVIVSLVGLALAMRSDLVSTTRPDWAAASRAIAEFVPETSVVTLEHMRPLGAHRPPFFGQPRYLDPSRSVIEGGRLMRNPTRLGEPRSVALLLLGASPEIPGFERIDIDGQFTLYLPIGPLIGTVGAATVFESVAVALPPRTGTHAALVAASLLAYNGDVEGACRLVGEYSLLGEEYGADTLRLTDLNGEYGVWLEQCSAQPTMDP